MCYPIQKQQRIKVWNIRSNCEVGTSSEKQWRGNFFKDLQGALVNEETTLIDLTLAELLLLKEKSSVLPREVVMQKHFLSESQGLSLPVGSVGAIE